MTDRNDDDIWNIPVDEMRGQAGHARRSRDKKPIDAEGWFVRLFVAGTAVVVVGSIIVGLTTPNIGPWAPAAASFPSIASTPDYGRWMLTNAVNPLNDTPVVAITVNAENNGGALITPTLTIRCNDGNLATYVNWQDYLGPEPEEHGLAENSRYTLLRFGDTPVRSVEGELSDDETATFFKFLPFLANLREVDRLVAQVTPYHSSPTTLVFDVTGIDAALDPIRQHCPQTPTPWK